MKTVGLIAEYNPFHNGHLHHINEAKKITGADCVVVIMSGDFVQRGTPAIMDKYQRTLAALSCGADFVFELPVCYATGSAEYFAEGAVRALDALGIVDCICFGSECGDVSVLSEIAQIIIDEPDKYSKYLQEYLKKGDNYAKARAKAFKHTFPKYADTLESPNNILGIEYIKALKKSNSNITPYTINRIGHAYHDTESTNPLASASAIRKLLCSKAVFEDLKFYIPESVHDLYVSNINRTFPITEDDFSSVLYFSLYNKFINNISFEDYFEINAELSNRINRLLPEFKGFSDFAMLLKNKAYTYSRICRGLIHSLLDIRAKELNEYRNSGWIFYNKLLGMRNTSANYETLNLISKASVPLLTSVKNSPIHDSLQGLAKNMLNTDIAATDIYEHISSIKYAREPLVEATRKFLKI
ncbi:MAG: nucleotidyltransferase [Lachnospiraceae bacterium]|nr:nucleotidyltransferase [Lachnospiraceae bacterium]